MEDWPRCSEINYRYYRYYRFSLVYFQNDEKASWFSYV